jgi:hypothetical protein
MPNQVIDYNQAYYQKRDETTEKFLQKQFAFTGEWQPNVDPLKLALENYSEIENFRYIDKDLESVDGYEKVTSSAITTYIKGRTGLQIRTPYTIKSLIFAQCFNTDLTASKVFLNIVEPPGSGTFEATEVFTDAAGAGIANINQLPLNNMLYCNGVETKIYAGAEQAIGAAFLADSISALTLTGGKDITDRVRNVLQDSLNIFTFATGKVFLFGTTRPIKAWKAYIKTLNASASSMSGYVWNGTSWGALTLTDGTSSGGKTLAIPSGQGSVSFTSTVGTVKPALIEGMSLYWYYFTISAGTADLYHVTVDCPIQNLCNLWDGQYRYCIQAQDKRGANWENYTAELAEISNSTYPIAAKWGGLTSSDQIILMFSRRTSAVKVIMIAGKVNAVAASFTVYYWNGSAFVTTGTVYDGTMVSSATLGQSGHISWDSPADGLEFPVTMFDTTGYAYKLVPNATLTPGTSNDGTSVDALFGVTATDPLPIYDFGFSFKNRVFLANYKLGKEANRLDYGPIDTIDCYNGDESSDGEKQLYIGDSDDLMTAVNIFNRFGSNLYNSELLLKKGSTFLLDGDGPSTFKLFTVSTHIGCPAPRTMVTAEIAYEISAGNIRNIALWLSARGPMLFDAAVLVPLRGIDNFFDATKTECINSAYIHRAHAWFDPNYNEYNLCFPSGTGQTECNVWVMYNLNSKRWSQKKPGTQPVPQATFQVNDTQGNIFIYALFNNGHMALLESGLLWNDTEDIQASITMGEHLPSGDIFDTTLMRRIKLLTKTTPLDALKYTRNDFIFTGSGYLDGNCRVYNEVIEDPLVTEVHFSGDDLHCKSIEEGATFVPNPPHYKETAGALQIDGEIFEGIQTTISTAAGDFVVAGFQPGYVILTDEPLWNSKYILQSVTADLLTFLPATRAAYVNPGVNRTLTAIPVLVEYAANGDSSYTLLTTVALAEGVQRVQRFVSLCNSTAFLHKVRFTFVPKDATTKIRPLAWGYQYLIERDDIEV